MKRILLGMCLAGSAVGLWAAPLSAQGMVEAEGGVIRWLDTLTGNTGTVEMQRGQSVTNGRLTIRMDACRYPAAAPTSDAEAHLTVIDSRREQPIFSGWMLASSPALSAMEHPRYDVWVLRCVIPGYTPPEAEERPEDADKPMEELFGE